MSNLMKQARATLSILNPDDILARAERPVTIGLVADASIAYAEMEDFLAPEGEPRKTWRGRMSHIHRANDPEVPASVDLVLYEPGLACPPHGFTFHRGNAETTVAEILREKAGLAMPLARQFPAFRKQVIEGIVHEVAKENALFALATSLPNILPSLLELPWIFGEFASDTVFLTANEMRMAFQIAAASGRNVGFRRQRGDLLAIGAGAFGWRALARELASHIPMGGGLIPKAAIAYAGTFVVGKGLEFYHYSARQPTNEERKLLYQEGLQHGRSFAESLPVGQTRA